MPARRRVPAWVRAGQRMRTAIWPSRRARGALAVEGGRERGRREKSVLAVASSGAARPTSTGPGCVMTAWLSPPAPGSAPRRGGRSCNFQRDPATEEVRVASCLVAFRLRVIRKKIGAGRHRLCCKQQACEPFALAPEGGSPPRGCCFSAAETALCTQRESGGDACYAT